MKRYKGSKLDRIARSFWVWFYANEWGTVGACGTSYTLSADMVLDFYFPENKRLDNCVVTAVEITIP